MPCNGEHQAPASFSVGAPGRGAAGDVAGDVAGWRRPADARVSSGTAPAGRLQVR